jgi:hypothetical protein
VTRAVTVAMSLAATPAMPRRLPALALAVAAVLMLGACGRRGALEPPGAAATPGPAAAAPATPRSTTAQAAEAAQAAGPFADPPDADEEAVAPVPTPAPANRRRRGYAVPPGPFILDPIL